MAKNTSISLGPHFDKFIEKQLKSGRYGTASEVVRESLRLLEEQEKNKAALRKALIAGEKSGIAGPIDLDKIKKAGRTTLKSKRKSAQYCSKLTGRARLNRYLDLHGRRMEFGPSRYVS